MEDNDGDSDVVLEDSPLYEHWKNAENDNFIPTQKHQNMPTHQNKPNIVLTPESSKSTPCVLSNTIDSVIIRRISDLIIQSKLLSETDYSLLRNFTDEHIARNIGKTPRNLSFKYALGLFLSLSLLFYCMFICLVLSLTTVLSSFAILFATLFYFQNVRKSLDHELRLEQLLEQLKLLSQLLKKAIRTIQEAELIARGFTLVSIRTPLKSLEASLTLPVRSPEKQCPELRQTVFNYCREMFLTCRIKTLHLLNRFPLHKDMDVASHYLACIDLEELGQLFTTEYNLNNTGKSYFLEITDNFSTSTLKATMEIMELQQSEFLRRFAFCFLAETDLNHLWRVLDPLLIELNTQTKEYITVLQKFHLYYSCLGKFSYDEIKDFSPKKDTLKPFRTAVRSLCLHLQSSLVRIQTLEETVEAIDGELDKQTLKNLLNSSCKSMMSEIESELNASNICLEECADCLNHLIEPKVRPKSIPSVSTANDNQKSDLNLNHPIPIFEMGDRVIVDEVFEGSAEKNEASNNWMDDDYSPVATKKSKPVNLMKELKSVLVVKAEEHKIREAKALGIELKPVTELCESDLQSNDDWDEDLNWKNVTAKDDDWDSPQDIGLNRKNFNPQGKDNEWEAKELLSHNYEGLSIASQAALRSKMFGVKCQSFGEEIGESDSDHSV